MRWRVAVTRSFNRWNVLARGFALPGNLNVQVDRDTATVDFLDVGTDGEGDDSNVFITLVKEDGGWKVCRSQATARGGTG